MYQYRRAITIDHTKCGSSNSSNFPFLFSGTYSYLATVANGGKVTSSNGYDIIFTSDIDGVAKLSHEIETYDAASGLVNFWVRVPTISYATDTVLYLWYSDSSISISQEDIANTWSANYKGVWHLPNGSALTALDSTGVNTATLVNAPAATAGKINGGASVSKANSSYLSVADHATLNPGDAITLQAWIYPTSLSIEPAPGLTGIISKYNTTTNSNNSYIFRIGRFPTNNTDLNFAFLDSNLTERNVYGSTINLNAWQHVAGTFNGSVLNTFQNGTITGSFSFTGSINAGSSILVFGRDYNANGNQRNFTGILDEIRISNVARTNDWILTDYNNQNSPSTFYSISNASIFSIQQTDLHFSDTIGWILRSYRIDPTRSLISDLILASVLIPPKLLADTQILADSVLRILHQYRLVTDTAALSDALVFAIQRHRGLLDFASPSSDRILSTVLQRDTVSSNRAKPISRPRWLFEANIGGTQRFSSEDLEKP